MNSGDFQDNRSSGLTPSSSASANSQGVGSNGTRNPDSGPGATPPGPRTQSGFLKPSIDEVGRLYGESPFSW